MIEKPSSVEDVERPADVLVSARERAIVPSAHAKSARSNLAPVKTSALSRVAAMGIWPGKWGPKIPVLWTSFMAIVGIPTLVVVFYFAFLASDQYVAEVRLAVRASAQSGEQKSASASDALSKLAVGGAPQLAGQEAHIVAEYLRSRAAIEDLGRHLDLPAIYRRGESDIWARLKEKPSAEELQKYWSSMIVTSVDGPSGIVTILVRAFRAEDARALAEACVKVSETLVNSLSERARRDALSKAEAEVRRTEGLLREALNKLRQFRDTEGYLDPAAAATSTSQLLLEALAERARLQSDMFVMTRALASNAPTLTALKDRIGSMDQQIGQLRGELTSSSRQSKTVSSALVRFEELELQRIFAEKLHGLAQGGLERARIRAEQQQIYLTMFVPPYLPEEAKYPERLAMSVIIPIMLLVLWSIFALTAAAIEDHLK